MNLALRTLKSPILSMPASEVPRAEQGPLADAKACKPETLRQPDGTSHQSSPRLSTLPATEAGHIQEVCQGLSCHLPHHKPLWTDFPAPDMVFKLFWSLVLLKAGGPGHINNGEQKAQTATPLDNRELPRSLRKELD